ncbi:MAG: peptidyl-prolyl cis-trans isomerase [Helicobacteraceae bacterium]|nr:peptidyl-prolyl cis-trans isomerase [Candidatus Sulfurimonas ponti]MBL6973135.1 peptidyl-prolyl cis-trans isomerase [Sulfurimonas sp.]
MYKYLITLVSGAALSANMVAGVAIVVKDEAITLYDIKKEMKVSNVNKEMAINTLVRQKLEESEIKTRKIDVSNTEVYDDIKQTAKRNNMSVSQLYEAALNANGISSNELKIKVKQKLLAQKLYNSIAYSQASRPTENELREYYDLNKESFSHPSSFTTVIYQTTDQPALAKKIENPMFYAPQIQTQEQELQYDRISPELANLLEKTQLNTFTPIVPDGKGGHMSFYVKAVKGVQDLGFDKMRGQIENEILGKKREQVLGDYFARLKENAEINILRNVE